MQLPLVNIRHVQADELAADSFDAFDEEEGEEENEAPIFTRVAGAMLPHERYDQMMLLPIVTKGEKEVKRRIKKHCARVLYVNSRSSADKR